MTVDFERVRHPRVETHRGTQPPRSTDERMGFNGRLAVRITAVVGTMWCAYAFGVLALVVLPEAVKGGLLPSVQWLSQTFIQLVIDRKSTRLNSSH